MANSDSPELSTALENIAKRNYRDAFTALTQLAEAGNAKARCNLATLYHFGLGVTPDGAKAAELYRSVAEQNIREECLSGVAYQNLATLYTTGLPGIEPDHHKAAHFSSRAKELGFKM